MKSSLYGHHEHMLTLPCGVRETIHPNIKNKGLILCPEGPDDDLLAVSGHDRLALGGDTPPKIG
jgi:hypothetical protein